MGPITDHGFEHLGPSDLMITRTRRRLLRAARALKKDGTVPPGVDDPDIYVQVRSGDFLADEKIAWRDAYECRCAPQSGRCSKPQNNARSPSLGDVATTLYRYSSPPRTRGSRGNRSPLAPCSSQGQALGPRFRGDDGSA